MCKCIHTYIYIGFTVNPCAACITSGWKKRTRAACEI